MQCKLSLTWVLTMVIMQRVLQVHPNGAVKDSEGHILLRSSQMHVDGVENGL